MNLKDISGSLPYDGKSVMMFSDRKQTTPRIIETMMHGDRQNSKDYERIANKFWQGNARDTAKLLFDLQAKYITYDVEPVSRQTVKTPGRYLKEMRGDCKHYSLFTTGVAQALHRQGKPIRAFYRFVADEPGMDVHHVFSVVVDENGNEIWVDPVMKTFDERPKFAIRKDVQPQSGIGAVYYLSGSSLSGTNNFYDLPMVGKTNILKKFVSSMQTNFTNLGKEVQHVTNEVKTVANQVAHGAQVNVANARKDVKHLTKEVKTVVNKQVNAVKTNIANVPDAINKVKNAAIKVTAVNARKAFLALLALNVHGFANSLDVARKNPQQAADLRKRWVNQLQGDWGTLMNTIDRGLKKKAIFGSHYDMSGMIGVEPATTAALITLAATVIAILGPLLKLKPSQQAALNNAATAGAAGILASTYTGAQLVDGAGNVSPAAAAAALNTLTAGSSATGTGLNMSVTPGVAPDGTPTVTVNDVGGTLPDGTPGGFSFGTLFANTVENIKSFIATNRGIVVAGGTTLMIIGAASASNKKNKKKGGAIAAIAAGLAIAAAGATVGRE